MARHKRRASNEIAREHIQQVQVLIERCLQSYMSRQEAEQYLEIHFKIQPDITRLIWQQLEEQNRDFFKWYHERYLLRNQVNQFNSLIQRQADMMEQMRVANQVHPQPGFSTVPNGNAQVLMPFPHPSEAPLQHNLHSALFPHSSEASLQHNLCSGLFPEASEAPLQHSIYSGLFPQASGLQLEASQQPHLDSAPFPQASSLQLEASLQPHLDAALFPQISNLQLEASLQLHLNAAPSMARVPHVTNLQPDLSMALAPWNNPNVPDLLGQNMQLTFPVGQQFSTLPQSGFHPSEAQPCFATPIAQNPAASAFRGNVEFPGVTDQRLATLLQSGFATPITAQNPAVWGNDEFSDATRYDISLMTPGISVQQIEHGMYTQEVSSHQLQQQLQQPGVGNNHQEQRLLKQQQQRQQQELEQQLQQLGVRPNHQRKQQSQEQQQLQLPHQQQQQLRLPQQQQQLQPPGVGNPRQEQQQQEQETQQHGFRPSRQRKQQPQQLGGKPDHQLQQQPRQLQQPQPQLQLQRELNTNNNTEHSSNNSSLKCSHSTKLDPTSNNGNSSNSNKNCNCNSSSSK